MDGVSEERERMLAIAQQDLGVAVERARNLQMLVDGLTGLLGLPPSRGSSRVRPKDAIIQAMSMHGLTPMKPTDILLTIRNLGLYDQRLRSGDGTYWTALRRMVKEPNSPIQYQDGLYVYTGPRPADD